MRSWRSAGRPSPASETGAGAVRAASRSRSGGPAARGSRAGTPGARLRPRAARAGVAALAAATVLCARADAATATGIDYEREARWSNEVVPSLVVGDAIWLETRSRPRVLAILAAPPGPAKGALVIVHGQGVHPDWGLVGGLRTRLTDDGYVTLSVQMPVLAADAPRDAYAATLPEAAERIASAVAYLGAKGYAKIAIVSHSLGATMADAYLAPGGRAPVAAWIPVGMTGGFAAPPREPVLDILAERDLPQVVASAPARAKGLPRDACSRQLTIAGADHYFEAEQKALAAAIEAFLDRAFAGRCGAQPG